MVDDKESKGIFARLRDSIAAPISILVLGGAALLASFKASDSEHEKPKKPDAVPTAPDNQPEAAREPEALKKGVVKDTYTTPAHLRVGESPNTFRDVVGGVKEEPGEGKGGNEEPEIEGGRGR